MAQPVAKTNGHPPGLYLLFGVEMWERFSYYGMRAILVLFMTKYLLFNTEKAGSIYGWYTGLVYMTPLIGGYLADRYLGQRKSIFIGGLIMAIGEFCLAVAAVSGAGDAGATFAGQTLFYLGLCFLIIGNGFFKPNISTTVGQLYEQNDPRRDGAFTIFYMGINLGALFSPLICGTLGERIGWQYGFAAAGVGMLAGLGMYLLGGKKYLGDAGMKPGYQAKGAAEHAPLTTEEKHRIAVIFIMAFFVIFFWASFEQAGSSLTLFADKSTNRMLPLINWEFPASWFQSVNPFLIFVLAPLFSSMWIRLAKAGREPSTPVKFVFGLSMLTLGMVVMLFAGALVDKGGPETKVTYLWLVGCYVMCTLGELCLSPVGLSMVTKLAPVRFASLLMGTWFLSNFAANLVGGLFAGRYDTMAKATFFMIPVATAGGATIILLFLVKTLKKWMHGIH
ncbi:MAG: peptide MFS transporter [Myxococcales bacterium]|nr:peptide MFS transporter [Myxococcales bacterium]